MNERSAKNAQEPKKERHGLFWKKFRAMS